MNVEQALGEAPTKAPHRWRLRAVAVVALVVGLAAMSVQLFLLYQAVVALSPTQYDRVDGAFMADDGRTIALVYMHGHCEAQRSAAIVEQSSQRVVLAVTHHTPPGPGGCILIGYSKVSYFELADPLGDRPVFVETRKGLEPLKLGSPIPERYLPPVEFRVD